MKILTSLFLLLFSISAFAGSEFVSRAQFTSLVADREPVNSVTTLDTSTSPLYFFTDIKDCKGCEVQHVWYLNGKLQLTLSGKASSDRYRWWSKVDPNGLTGTWKVETKVKGRVHATRTLQYTEAVQMQQAPVQTQLFNKLNSDCEVKLQEFSQKSRQYPDDPYFRFMLNKWGERCYGK